MTSDFFHLRKPTSTSIILGVCIFCTYQAFIQFSLFKYIRDMTNLGLIHSPFRPIAPIQISISNSLAYMLHLHTFRSIEISNGTCNF